MTGLALSFYVISFWAVQNRPRREMAQTNTGAIWIPGNILINHFNLYCDPPVTIERFQKSLFCDFRAIENANRMDIRWRDRANTFRAFSFGESEGVAELGVRPDLNSTNYYVREMSWRFPEIGQINLPVRVVARRLITFIKRETCKPRLAIILDPNVRSLVDGKLVSGLLQSFSRLPRLILAGFPRISLTFLGKQDGFFRCVGRLLRDTGLPQADSQPTHADYDQPECESAKSAIRFDLISLELVIFIIASLAGDLFLTFRLINNNSASFKMEGTLILILFSLGQFCVYLLCRRMYGL